MKNVKRSNDPRHPRVDDGYAFLPDVVSGEPGSTASAADAEFFGEEFIGAATTGESQSEARDEVVDEEEGGPFIVLREDGSLPSDGTEQHDAAEADGHSPVEREQTRRGGRWAARGA